MANEGTAAEVAFCDYVIGQAQALAVRALARKQSDIGEELLGMCEVAGKRRRELLGLPEPDPTIDYDPDYHWDGTERLPGEPRREKGDPAPAGYDLSALRVEPDTITHSETAYERED